MKTNKKISLGLFVGIIAINIFLASNKKHSDVDLYQLSNMAIANNETDPEEGDPIYEPTTVDWLLDLIGF